MKISRLTLYTIATFVAACIFVSGCVSPADRREYEEWLASDDDFSPGLFKPSVSVGEFVSKYKEGWRERAKAKHEYKEWLASDDDFSPGLFEPSVSFDEFVSRYKEGWRERVKAKQEYELLVSCAQDQSIDEEIEGIFLRLCELNKVDTLPYETIESMAKYAQRKDVKLAAIQSLKDVDKAKSIIWNVPVDAELFKGFLKSYGTEDVVMELIKSSNRRLLTKEITDIILEHTKSQQVADAIANLNASSELKGLGGMRLGVKYNVADRKLLKGLSDIGCYEPDIDYYVLSNHKNKLPGFGYYRMFLTPETGTLFRLSAHSESDELEFGDDGVPTLVRGFEEKFGLQFVKAETSDIIKDRTTWSARVGDLVVSVNTSFYGSPVSPYSHRKSWVEVVDESLEKLAKDETVRLRAKAAQEKKHADEIAMDKAFGVDTAEEPSGSTATLEAKDASKAKTIDGVLSREEFLAIMREANFRSNTGNEIRDKRIRDEHRSRVMGKVITVKGTVKSIEVTMFTDYPKLILNVYGKSVSARMDGMSKDAAAELDAGMEVIVRGTVCDRLVTSDLALENCVIVK